jgi:hypothetical protein
MTDLDTLRQALRATPEPRAFIPDDLDVAVIVRRGRRLRARRRLTVAAGAACVAAAAFGAVSGVGHTAAPAVSPAGPGRIAPASQPGRRGSRPTATPKASPARETSPTPSGTASVSPSGTASVSPSATPSAAYATRSSAVPSASATTPVPIVSPSDSAAGETPGSVATSG